MKLYFVYNRKEDRITTGRKGVRGYSTKGAATNYLNNWLERSGDFLKEDYEVIEVELK